ncbi:probable RNA-directed DNA polymerase from transposon X-element [Trichonephila clavipes]|nr:probable RNA-directed DNA polymerase from transposon X-element [Trichonephila clavipes]
MQIKLDPFRKSNRVTQCYNCNNFHHASQNCFMKTRCLKCGENHRTGECSIKEKKIENPLCINCNANGHMASSTECPLFPKPRKGAGKTAAENRKRNETNKISQVIPGLSFAQVLNPNKSQQMATRGNASSASNQNIETNQTNNNDKNKNSKKVTVNNNQNGSNENDRTHPAPGRGGTAILIKNFISHYHVPTPPLLTGVEGTLITITPIDYDPILVGSIYIPPINNYFRNLGAALDTIFNFNNKKLFLWEILMQSTPRGVATVATPEARSTSEIENEVRELTSEILTAHGNASKPVTHSEVPFVQGELKHLFKERNRARKIWQFTRHPQDKTNLNRLQNTIKRKVNLYRQQVWEEHLTSLDTEDGSLWGTAKAFRRKAAPISALNGPTGTALSDTHKTELIAQSLESQFKLNDIQNPHKDEYITNTVDAYFTANTNNTDQIPPALPSEVIFYIKKIKVRKCPGRDGITNKMLKHLPLITIFKITNIINNMLNLRYFPSAWKTAVVVPILKPGKDPTLAESHRPISLLPILSKLAEKIISTRLNDFLETNKILIPEQHGFRPRLSTTHQLLRVVEYIKEGNNMGQCTAAVFLDIQKAFDRVWHTGLLFKLINYNIPTPLILLFKFLHQ